MCVLKQRVCSSRLDDLRELYLDIQHMHVQTAELADSLWRKCHSKVRAQRYVAGVGGVQHAVVALSAAFHAVGPVEESQQMELLYEVARRVAPSAGLDRVI
jgi:hypothetical protein